MTHHCHKWTDLTFHFFDRIIASRYFRRPPSVSQQFALNNKMECHQTSQDLFLGGPLSKIFKNSFHVEYVAMATKSGNHKEIL